MTKVAIVGDDQEPCGAIRAVDQSNVVNQGEDHGVGAPRAAVADRCPGGDPLAAQAALGRAVENQLNPDGGRDDRPKSPDQRGRGCRATGRATAAGRPRQAVEQVRAVDQQSICGRERVAIGGGHGPPSYAA